MVYWDLTGFVKSGRTRVFFSTQSSNEEKKSCAFWIKIITNIFKSWDRNIIPQLHNDFVSVTPKITMNTSISVLKLFNKTNNTGSEQPPSFKNWALFNLDSGRNIVYLPLLLTLQSHIYNSSDSYHMTASIYQLKPVWQIPESFKQTRGRTPGKRLEMNIKWGFFYCRKGHLHLHVKIHLTLPHGHTAHFI